MYKYNNDFGLFFKSFNEACEKASPWLYY